MTCLWCKSECCPCGGVELVFVTGRSLYQQLQCPVCGSSPGDDGREGCCADCQQRLITEAMGAA